MKLTVSRFVLTSLFASMSSTAFAAVDATSTLVNIDLEPGLLTEVQEALPESIDVNQEFLSDYYNPNIILQSDAHVAVTFLDEGAGYKNSLGYFTFSDTTFDGYTFGDLDTDGSGHIGISELQSIDGIDAGMVFNNSSEAGGGGSLVAGDTVTLGGATITNVSGTDFDMTGGTLFEEGTNVGFFLLQNAWDGSEVQGWDDTGTDPLAMYTVDFLNPENSTSATIDNADDYSRHVAMMTSTVDEDAVILGFEDLVRPYGDNDFNDAVFIVSTDPVTALFADVPSTETVISLQAAPAPEIGGLSGLFSLAFGGLLFLRRKNSKQEHV